MIERVRCSIIKVNHGRTTTIVERGSMTKMSSRAWSTSQHSLKPCSSVFKPLFLNLIIAARAPSRAAVMS
jgi:hypothetical protein